MQVMRNRFQRLWRWLACKNNRGRVIAISNALGVIIAAITFVVLLLTPSSEDGMSVLELEGLLETQRERVIEELALAHGIERIRLENEIKEITRQLADVQAAHAERQELIRELESSLARWSTYVDDDAVSDAQTALKAGDLAKAEDVLAMIESRTDAAVARAAEAAFQRGQLAATQIRWDDAAVHFSEAARLDPTYHHLEQAGTFARLSGLYATALRHQKNLLDHSRLEYGDRSPQTGAALSNLANVLSELGRYAEAESLYRQALEIDRETFGEAHPDYAKQLNNLANLLLETKRYDEAEPLYRQALQIGQETVGERHPDYAARLNNLANLLFATRRYDEAEPLYRQALEIGRNTLGQAHPDYAARLNNLASLLSNTGRYWEAKPLFLQALEKYRAVFGNDHATTRRTAANYSRFLQAYFPDDPVLLQLRVELGEDVGGS